MASILSHSESPVVAPITDQPLSKNVGQTDGPGTTSESFVSFYQKYTAGLMRCINALDVDAVDKLVKLLLVTRAKGKRIFFIGNGGSAATASHAATDFSKERFSEEHLLFKAISLTDNTSLITATGNDLGYEQVFVQQLKTLMTQGDLVIAISSSGNSENILQAVEYARSKGAYTVGVVGFDGGKLQQLADTAVHIPTKNGQYGFMEDISLMIVHIASIYLFEYDQRHKEETTIIIDL